MITFNSGEVCGYCSDGIVELKKVRVKTSANRDCKLCMGTGEVFVSSQLDQFLDCDCVMPSGPKFSRLFCSCCGHFEHDKNRTITARRVRAHVRLMEVKGYSKFLQRIESQFVDGMGWHNRSEWHIDHIRPIKLFLDEGVTDIYTINALENLQPLWASDNLKKGARY